MLTTIANIYAQISEWLNGNQGVVAVTLFVVTLFFGWVSGIFATLRRRPKFKMSLVEGPTVARQLSWPVRVNYLGRLTLGNLLG